MYDVCVYVCKKGKFVSGHMSMCLKAKLNPFFCLTSSRSIVLATIIVNF
jgi:hypothetical protein